MAGNNTWILRDGNMNARPNTGERSHTVPHRRWWIGVLLAPDPRQLFRPHHPVGRRAATAAGIWPECGQIGLIFSIFFWSYALLQIPSGGAGPLRRHADRRIGAAVSLATALTALAGGVGGIIAARLLLVLPEPRLPANAKATGMVPAQRARVGDRNLRFGRQISNVIGAPLIGLAWLISVGAAPSGRWRC